MFKWRLNDNMHRSIVLAKGGPYWVFAYLFAKKDRVNIDPDEHADFKKLAQAYGRMTQAELASAPLLRILTQARLEWSLIGWIRSIACWLRPRTH